MRARNAPPFSLVNITFGGTVQININNIELGDNG